MKNTIKIYYILIFTSFIILSCGPIDPSEKGFYKLSETKPYRFDKGGIVETWDQGKEYYDKSCSAIGRWKMDGAIVVIEGVYNPNCPWMTERNGRFRIDGEYLWRE